MKVSSLGAAILSFAALAPSVGPCQTVRSTQVRIQPVSPVIAPAALGEGSLFSGGGLSNPTLQQGSLPSLQAPRLTLSQAPDLALAVAGAWLPQSAVAPQAPAAIPDPKTQKRGLTPLSFRELEPLVEAAKDVKATPDSSWKTGQDIQNVLSGAVQEDLPPAGPVEGLTPAQADWLRAELVTGAHPVLTETGFKALALGDAESSKQVLAWLASSPSGIGDTLSAMYQSLRRVLESGLPAAERHPLAQNLNEAFGRATGSLSESPALNVAQRKLLAQVHDRYLRTRAAVFELAHYRQTLQNLNRLDAEARRLLAPAPAQQAGPAQAAPEERPWNVKPPIPKEQRGAARDGETTIVSQMSDWARNVQEWEFLLEKHLGRYRIVMEPGRFSERTRTAVTSALVGLLQDYRRKAGILFTGVERIAAYSLPQSMRSAPSLTGEQRRVVWIPDNKNLRLAAEPGGWVVSAAFETDIQDDAAIAAAKASIEEYWSGTFEWRGKEQTFRTRVSIRKLAPGQAFSEGSLSIRDNARWISLAGPGIIMLGHELNYATPAHEFGHTLGLADEYRNVYDAQSAASVEVQNPASIMSSLSGRVLPRHLKTAFLLLRRRSLGRP